MTNFTLGHNLTFGLLEAIGRDIVCGKYDDIPFPTELELSIREGVSRSVVREATKMLASKGLVCSVSKCGTYVQPLESWHLYDDDVLRWMLERRDAGEILAHLRELRLTVEPAAAALAAGRASEEELAALVELAGHIVKAGERFEPLADSVAAFHAGVLRASGNAMFARIGRTLAAVARISTPVHRGGAEQVDPARYAAAARWMQARDADRASAAMEDLVGGGDDRRDDRAA